MRFSNSDTAAVINPLPNSMHCEWPVKAAEAKKHIHDRQPMLPPADALKNTAVLVALKQAAREGKVVDVGSCTSSKAPAVC